MENIDAGNRLLQGGIMLVESLDKLSDDWEGTSTLAIYGLGKLAIRYLSFLQERFEIPYIIDNAPEKKGSYYAGIPVVSQESLQKELFHYKIVILTGKIAYKEISEMLLSLGMIEHRNFTSMWQFLIEWNWRFRKAIILPEIHIAITTACTLKCKNCNMYIPYYQKRYIETEEKIADNLNLFFQTVEYVFQIELLGGEPFLNLQLPQILETFYQYYGKRFGGLRIVTNGTILPQTDTLKALKKYQIEIFISNYHIDASYEQKLWELQSAFKEWGIRYKVNDMKEWKDFGFPQKALFDFQGKAIRRHMLQCNPTFHGLNDNKFYFCHLAWSADKSGLRPVGQGDYVELPVSGEEQERERFIQYALGLTGEVSLCRICGGCGSDNPYIIQAGLQNQ